MRALTNYKVQSIVLISLSLLIVLGISRLGMSSILADRHDYNALKSSLSYNNNNAEAANYLAEFYKILMIEDEAKAQELFAISIKNSPLSTDSWLGLTETLLIKGEFDKARLSLTKALELIPSSIGFLWRASLLAFSLGENEIAMDKLNIVAKADPQRRQMVFDTVHRIESDNNLILNRVVSDEILGDYLNFLMRNDLRQETYSVWTRMERVGNIPSGTALSYIDYLLRKDDAIEAKRIWSKLNPGIENNSLIWNGSYETEPSGRGLDWRIGKVDGAEIEFDYEKKTDGDKSLTVTFSGDNNLDFRHVSQLVPVEPNTNYILTSDISTSALTTQSGLRWHVHCKGLNEFSETYTGTVDWTSVSLPFLTPPDCNVLHVRLIRTKSQKLDNLISGQAWIDNVKLFRFEEATDA